MADQNVITTKDPDCISLARELSDTIELARWQARYDLAVKLAREGYLPKWWDEDE